MMIRQVDKSQTAPDKIVPLATCSRAGVRLLGLAAPPRLSELIFMFLCIVKLCHDDRCQLGLWKYYILMHLSTHNSKTSGCWSPWGYILTSQNLLKIIILCFTKKWKKNQLVLKQTCDARSFLGEDFRGWSLGVHGVKGGGEGVVPRGSGAVLRRGSGSGGRGLVLLVAQSFSWFNRTRCIIIPGKIQVIAMCRQLPKSRSVKYLNFCAERDKAGCFFLSTNGWNCLLNGRE